MADKDKTASDPPEKEDEEIEIPSPGETTIPASDEPAPPPPGKTIHRRRPLPPVKD